jgi:tetratricopeptide (TPR) repeat protein
VNATPLARFMAARVSVARHEFAAALAAVDDGIAAQSSPHADVSAPTHSVGLYWLRGLLLLRDGQVARAIVSFAREIDGLPDKGQDDVRRDAQVGAGFAHLAAGDAAGAIDAFRLALETQPRHGRALIGLQYAFRQTSLAAEAELLTPQIDRAVAAETRYDEAAQLAAAAKLIRGDRDGACETLMRLLMQAPPGLAGWTIPIDPALSALRQHREYQTMLALLASRAR